MAKAEHAEAESRQDRGLVLFIIKVSRICQIVHAPEILLYKPEAMESVWGILSLSERRSQILRAYLIAPLNYQINPLAAGQ